MTSLRDTFVDLRPELFVFAQEMEKELRQNDHKIGWKNLPVHHLLARTCEELKEVIQTLVVPAENVYEFRVAGHHLQCAASILRVMGPYVRVTGNDDSAGELADVANYCMMLADVLGGLSGK